MVIKLGPGVQIANREFVQRRFGELFQLIVDYFERSRDKSSTPGKIMVDISEKIDDKDYLLVVHETEGKLDGFIVGKIVAGPVGRILMAFLGKGLDSKTIIREALETFDDWAREHKCIASDLYTHRHPKSYASLKTLGWRHNYTVYRRDYL